jgi:hypothetical protein
LLRSHEVGSFLIGQRIELESTLYCKAKYLQGQETRIRGTGLVRVSG